MKLQLSHNDADRAVISGGDDVAPEELARLDEADRLRVSRGLRERARYRYVHPTVRVVSLGVRIQSPCCSRNVDPSGGTVNIALVQRLRTGQWRLHRMDHAAAAWQLHGVYDQLDDLLRQLNNDPDRLFWQ